MKRKAIVGIIPPILALVLEVLPYGAVLNFANPDGDAFRHTYSYFSLIPFGYANAAPFFTALLTCVLLLLAFIGVFRESRALHIGMAAVSAAALVLSLLPLLFGIDSYSVVGALITLALLAELIVSCRTWKR